ncbi:hypothetical protein ACIQAC_23815 [Streptomyces sp. NPDC088387]|uniref:hypothetical protein n=1 Tax=Streptomyces sp. NPDC088387 TaxID=3365859 RepID=UPI003826695A
MNAPVLAGRSVRGATALRGGRMWRPTPYQACGLLFWLVMSLAYWRVPLCCDAGLDAAVVERLATDLAHPRHPTADLPGAGSPYYSPYALAQALFARLTGLGGWEVVRLAGPLNLLVLLAGVGRFARMLSPRPWAPVLALGATTLLWGTRPVRGDGSLGLLPLTTGMGGPWLFAVGLTLWVWGVTGERVRPGAGRVRFVGPSGLPGPAGYVALGAVYGVILLVDPFVAVGAFAGAAALVAGCRPAVLLRWGLAAVTAAVVAWSWPYYEVFAAFGTERRPAPGPTLGQYWLALLTGLPALWLRARRSAWRDPLVVMAVPGCALLAYGGWGGGSYGDVVGLALVPLWFALAVELAAPRPWPSWRRALGAVAVAGACAGFLTVQAGAVVPRSLDPVGFPQAPRGPSYAWAAQHIGRGDVVLAEGGDTVHGLAGHGIDVVAPAVPDPALEEAERLRRVADVRAYLSPGSTRADRAAVVHRYRVRWLVLTGRRTVPEEAVVVAWSGRTGEVLARVTGRAGGA